MGNVGVLVDVCRRMCPHLFGVCQCCPVLMFLCSEMFKQYMTLRLKIYQLHAFIICTQTASHHWKYIVVCNSWLWTKITANLNRKTSSGCVAHSLNCSACPVLSTDTKHARTHACMHTHTCTHACRCMLYRHTHCAKAVVFVCFLFCFLCYKSYFRTKEASCELVWPSGKAVGW